MLRQVMCTLSEHICFILSGVIIGLALLAGESHGQQNVPLTIGERARMECVLYWGNVSPKIETRTVCDGVAPMATRYSVHSEVIRPRESLFQYYPGFQRLPVRDYNVVVGPTHGFVIGGRGPVFWYNFDNYSVMVR